MSGSDPGTLVSPGTGGSLVNGPFAVGEPPAPRPASSRARRPTSRERVLRAPLWRQLCEGSWPFTLKITLPPLMALVAFAIAAVTGEVRSLWGVVGAVGVAALEFASLAAKRPQVRAGRVTPCCWIALGDGHIRLGMTFFRPKILFEQIAGMERGVLKGGEWTPDPYGSRIRVRFVLRNGWGLGAVAYPVGIDPHGELTMRLRFAAAHNQDRLRFSDTASDEEVTEAYQRLEAAYRAVQPPADSQTPATANAVQALDEVADR
jgi:hypothetical protein